MITNVRAARLSFPISTSARRRLLGEQRRQQTPGPDLPGGAGRGCQPPRWWGPVRGGDREWAERSPGLQHHLTLVLLGGSAAGQSERSTAACGELAAQLLPGRPQQEVPHQNRLHQQGKKLDLSQNFNASSSPRELTIGMFPVRVFPVPSLQLRKL